MKRIISSTLPVFSALMLLCPQIPLKAEPLWVEGKDAPSRRVNTSVSPASLKVYANVADAVKASVVNISANRNQESRLSDQGIDQFKRFFGDEFFERFFGGPQGGAPDFPGNGGRPAASLGSGFVLSHEGYIVTNNHVVDKSDDIRVILSDEREYPATVVGKDAKTDIALLKIEPKGKLSPVILGDSDAMKVGDPVVAIGNPFGLSQTTTQGIVSAKERSIGFGAYDDFIQTDASINPGNSGGPLLNIYGEVIGINTAIVASGQGIGFAIPINLAKNIITSLKQDGVVIRGWLGVMIQKMTEELATSLKLPQRWGALVSDVVEQSPARSAGIQSGDVIVSFDGKTIQDYHQLPILVASTAVGKTVPVELYRDGKKITLKVTIEQLKDSTDEKASVTKPKSDRLGLMVRDLPLDLAKETGRKGVLVSNVLLGGAAEKQIRRGDVLLEINKQRIDSVADYKKVVAKLPKKGSVLVRVKRQKALLFVAIPLS